MAKISMLQYHASTVKTTIAANTDSAGLTTITADMAEETGDTTVNVADSSKIEVNQLVKIDSEVMLVKTIHSSTSVTFTRSQSGTAEAAHSNGANVNYGLNSTVRTLVVADACSLDVITVAGLSLSDVIVGNE